MRIYPRWIYHAAELAGRIVQSAEEEKSLGEGWADTPAAFLEKVPGELVELKEQSEVLPGHKASKKQKKAKEGSSE